MVRFFKDRGNVTSEFEQNGRLCKLSRGLHKSSRAALEVGQVVIFDPKNPVAAFLRDLFT